MDRWRGKKEREVWDVAKRGNREGPKTKFVEGCQVPNDVNGLMHATLYRPIRFNTHRRPHKSHMLSK